MSTLRLFRRSRNLRWYGLLVVAVVIVVTLAVTLHGAFEKRDIYRVPSDAGLTRLSLRQRIVDIADSQVGYSTEPTNSYCNKFSAYWNAGTSICPSGELSEEWCSDFAAWVWHLAGVDIIYGYNSNDINGAAVSFYQWGVANDKWHAATSGYVAAPGDVAIYGLSLGADPSAAHVAIVTADSRGERGPDVVNGDGDKTGFSVVEFGADQVRAVSDHDVATLSGYVSPP